MKRILTSLCSIGAAGGARRRRCRALSRALVASQLALVSAVAWAGDGGDRPEPSVGQRTAEADPDAAIADLRARLAAARDELEGERAARSEAALALMARERDLHRERQRSALLDRQVETLRAQNEAAQAAAAREASLLATRDEIAWMEGLLASIPRFTVLAVDLPLPVPGSIGKPGPSAGRLPGKPRLVAVPSPMPAGRPAPAAAATAVLPAPGRRPRASQRLAETVQRIRRRAFMLPDALRPLSP